MSKVLDEDGVISLATDIKTLSDATYVSKTGDTMTGQLVTANSVENPIKLKNTDVTVGTAPSANAFQSIIFTDNSSNILGKVRGGYLTDKRGIISLIADNGYGDTNSMSLYVAEDGSSTVFVSHPTQWRSALNAVNKAGDTMTGRLQLTSTEDIPLAIIDTTYGLSNLPSSAAYRFLSFREKGDVAIGAVYSTLTAAGETRINIRARNVVNDANVDNVLYLGAKADGSRIVYVTDQKAWCKALQAFDCNVGTEIPENANLNNYTSPGVYFSPNATRSATITNSPSTGAGYKLIVFYKSSSSSLMQKVYLNGASTMTYIRYIHGSTIGSWTPVLNGTVSIANGGTGATTASAALTNLGAVAKAGDTMTGGLVVQISGNPTIMGDNDLADVSATSETAARYWTWGHRDKNNRYVSYWQSSHSTSGTSLCQIGARKYINDEYVNNLLSLSIDKDGNRAVSFTSVAAWRIALGIGSSTGSLPLTIAQGGTGLTSSPSMLTNLGSTTAANVLAASPRPGITGTLSIAHGGTGNTAISTVTTISSILTAATNFTITYASYSVWGKVAQLEFIAKPSTNITPSDSGVLIATLVSGKRPVSPVETNWLGEKYHMINTNGQITVYNNISSGSQTIVRVTYLLA